MNAAQVAAAGTARRLNHVEMAHRPGESGLVVELFEALGCRCHEVDTEPYGLYVVVELDGSPHGENDIFVSQAEPEQLAFEDALHAQMQAQGSALAEAGEGFLRMQRERPFRATHVGLRSPNVATLDETIARLTALRDGKLGRRLHLGEIITRTPEESLATSAPVKQLWVWTDVMSTGLMTVGQQIELQAYSL
jgi:hypothetical protein